jgi:hypothetical protein
MGLGMMSMALEGNRVLKRVSIRRIVVIGRVLGMGMGMHMGKRQIGEGKEIVRLTGPRMKAKTTDLLRRCWLALRKMMMLELELACCSGL